MKTPRCRLILLIAIFIALCGSCSSGIYLMFWYRPTLELAFNDILALRDVTNIGIGREIHAWSSGILATLLLVHFILGARTALQSPMHPLRRWCGLVAWAAVLVIVGAGWLSGRSLRQSLAERDLLQVLESGNLPRATPFLGNNSHIEPDILSQSGNASQLSNEAALNRFYIVHCIGLPFGCLLLAIAARLLLGPSPKHAIPDERVQPIHNSQ